MRLLKWLLAINLIGLMFFSAAWFLAGIDHAASFRVTELDRSQIINEAKLQQYRPDLAANLRLNLGLWIAESERASNVRTAQVGIIFCVVQILFVSLALRKFKRCSVLPVEPGQQNK
jgi:hypothetical protein